MSEKNTFPSGTLSGHVKGSNFDKGPEANEVLLYFHVHFNNQDISWLASCTNLFLLGITGDIT